MDSNPIHMIQIPLFVTVLYTIGINEVYSVIILSNTCMFPVRFVLFSVYYSFLFTATGASLVDQYPITLVHIVGFKIIKI